MSTLKTQLVCIFGATQIRRDCIRIIKSLGFSTFDLFENAQSIAVDLDKDELLTFEFSGKKIIVKDVRKIVGAPNFKEFLKKVMAFRDLETAFIGNEHLEEMPRADFEYHANPYFFCFEISKAISKKEMIDLIEKHSWEPIKNENSIGLLRKFEFADKKYWAKGEESAKLIQEKLESKAVTLSKDFMKNLTQKTESELQDYTADLDLRKGPFVFPRYFVRKEVRKRGIELEEGLAEKYAKELGIE